MQTQTAAANSENGNLDLNAHVPRTETAEASAAAPGAAQGGEVATNSSENLHVWEKFWDEGKITFHRSAPHRHLLKFGPDILRQGDLEKGQRVFVPLCGKTLDLAFLSELSVVSEVVGVEGVEKAVLDLQAESPALQLSEREERLGGFRVFASSESLGVSVLLGDFFSLSASASVSDTRSLSALQLEPFDFVWDRAALIAVEPSLRQDYVRILHNVTKCGGGRVLLVACDRAAGSEEARQKGPPFSLPEEEVRLLFCSPFWNKVEKVHSSEEIENYERFKQQGLTSYLEEVYVITRTA